jgi:ABC-type glycerol-3-phosphate transport system substrate-binding protein
MKKAIAAAVIAASAIGVGATLAPAQASAPVVSTSTQTNTLVSPKCYYHYSKTVTYMHWSTTAGRYVAYSSPRTTVTTYTSCHS